MSNIDWEQLILALGAITGAIFGHRTLRRTLHKDTSLEPITIEERQTLVQRMDTLERSQAVLNGSHSGLKSQMTTLQDRLISIERAMGWGSPQKSRN